MWTTVQHSFTTATELANTGTFQFEADPSKSSKLIGSLKNSNSLVRKLNFI